MVLFTPCQQTVPSQWGKTLSISFNFRNDPSRRHLRQPYCFRARVSPKFTFQTLAQSGQRISEKQHRRIATWLWKTRCRIVLYMRPACLPRSLHISSLDTYHAPQTPYLSFISLSNTRSQGATRISRNKDHFPRLFKSHCEWNDVVVCEMLPVKHGLAQRL